MISVAAFRGQRVAVLGLARSGMSAARALAAGGARPFGWDDDAAARGRAALAGIDIEDPLGNWSDVALLVASPGVPLHQPTPHPIVADARRTGREVIGDLELFARARPEAHVVGVTGTNGKSTTTALVGHVLAAAGRPVAVGGNLGTPVLDLEPLPADGVYVLELSSYGLDLTRSLACEVAVLLNVSPDHLERHGDMAGYVAAKRRIFVMQRPGATAIVGVDDDAGLAAFGELEVEHRLRVVPVSVGRAVVRGVYAIDGRVIEVAGGRAEPVVDLTRHGALIGPHNWQNAAAAVAALRALGLAGPAIAAAVASFPGLPHRVETVGAIGAVRFVNDSKATNADAAARALACFQRIHWIVGGRPKAGGLSGTEPHWSRVRRAYLIGEAAEAFERTFAGHVATTRCAGLAEAVTLAAAAARAEGRDAVVLLSPACASFDQFRDFEARGDAFRAAVAALKAGDAA